MGRKKKLPHRKQKGKPTEVTKVDVPKLSSSSSNG